MRMADGRGSEATESPSEEGICSLLVNILSLTRVAAASPRRARRSSGTLAAEDRREAVDESTPTSTGSRAQRHRAARGSAQPLLHEAAAELLAGVTLDDLTAFVTVGRLAAEAGVSNGAIYSAYQPTHGINGRPRSAPQAAVRDMFLSVGAPVEALGLDVIGAIERLARQGSTSSEIIESVAEVLARVHAATGRGENGWMFTHLLLASSTAVNDPETRMVARDLFEVAVRHYAVVVGVILELTERAPAEGVTVEELARMLVDVAVAGSMRLRVDLDAEPGVVAALFTAVFAGATRRRDDHEDDLLGRLSVLNRSVTADERDRIVAAVARIVDRSGWEEVTLTRVGKLAGVDRSSLVAFAPTRHHLATSVWADVAASIGRRAQNRAVLDPEVRLVELVNDVADAACSRRALVASLLHARLYDGMRDGDDVEETADPVVEILAELLIERAGGEVGLRRVAARTAVDALLLGAATTDAAGEELAAVLIRGLRPDQWGSVGATPYDP